MRRSMLFTLLKEYYYLYVCIRIDKRIYTTFVLRRLYIKFIKIL